MDIDILITNGRVLTLNRSDTILSSGTIAIADRRIIKVLPEQTGTQGPTARKRLDAEGGIVMPGLVNTHTHLPMSLFRGLADDLPLDDWLHGHIFPAEARMMTPANVRIGALLSCAEMLLSGTTRCCDGYFHEDTVIQAAAEIGIGGVFGQGVVDFPAPGVPDPARNVQTAANFALRWRDRPTGRLGAIFCHAPYTCSPETLVAAKRAADSAGVLFQIHVAETRTEVEQYRRRQGMTPVAHLDQLGILDPNTLLVHCVWLSAADIEIIANSGARVSHNPESNMKLASGIAPIPELIAAGVTVGLGSDGCASNNNLDLFTEMDTAAKLHKTRSLDPTAADAATILRMATCDAARAIGLEDITGSIEVGKRADIIVLQPDLPHLLPLYHPYSQIVYSASGGDVRHVIADGRLVVENRQLRTIDLPDLLRSSRQIARRIASAE